MPTKSTTPRHREHRAWGSRFDSLNISPSPISSPGSSPKKLTTLPDSNSAVIAEKETSFLCRSWADDDVPATLNSSQSISDAADPASDTSSAVARRDAPRLPHAASVFVGSLPTNVNEAELSQSLRQHLSNTAKIHGIKIIHDNKGGVCAFVQCENAAQASEVILRSHTAPQLFMGRYLRFESARAFRSLWISYRTPMSFIPGETKLVDYEATTFKNESKIPGRWVKGEVPKEMRIWWPREARYPIVTYGPEAENVDAISKDNADTSFDKEGSLTTGGVYFDNVTLDADIMHKIVSAFGPLESFEVCKHFPQKEGSNAPSYPIGHDVLRDPNMESAVWEVKWEHRDDCVCALNTLKRIPFISVTWANQPTSQVGLRASMSRNSLSPRFQNAHGGRSHSYLHLLEDPKMSSGGLSPSRSFTMKYASTSTPGTRPVGDRSGHLDHPEDSDDSWTVVRPHLQGLGRSILLSQSNSSQSFDRLSSVPSVESVKAFESSPRWNERDFPPLHVPHIKQPDEIPETDEEETLSCADAKEFTADADSSLLDCNKTDDADVDGDDTKSESASTSSESDGKSPSRRAFSHRRSLSNPIPRNHSLGIPPTPELANNSSLSPTTPASTVPVTPMYVANLPLMVSASACEVEGAVAIQDEHSSAAIIGMDTRIDLKTVFVGGLESTFPTGAWTEDKLQNIFKKYGDVEVVKLVKPSIKKSAFAFVTFSTEDAAQRAVDEEHNRIYNGRSIRVQLREIQPGRFGFKFRRGGRGRNFGTPHIVSTDLNPGEMYKSQSTEQIRDGHNLLGLSNDGNDYERATNVSMVDTDRMQRSKIPYLGRDSAYLPLLHSQDMNTETHASREQDSRTSVSITPPPSIHSLPVSTGATTPSSVPVPYGYYHHPWMPPYLPGMPYALPVGHYTGMVPHYPPYQPANNTNADGTAVQNPALAWNPMYRGPMPYSYPYIAQASQDTARVQQHANSSTPVKERPPLYPTGFIQGEHGTLIPVYQPEDLNQYMNGNSPTQTSPQNGSASSQNQTGAQQNTVSGHGPAIWPTYPPPHHFYAYASHAAVPSNVSPSSQQQAIHQQVHGHSLPGQWPPTPARQSLAQVQVPHFPPAAMTGASNVANATGGHPVANFYPPHPYGQPRPLSSHFSQNGAHQDVPSGAGRLHPHALGRTPKREQGGSGNHRSPSNVRGGNGNGIHGHAGRPDNHRFFASAPPTNMPDQSLAPCPPGRAKPGVLSVAHASASN